MRQRPRSERPTRSVEASNGIDGLKRKRKRKSMARDGQIRKYVMSHDLLLDARLGTAIYLLSIRHHRHLNKLAYPCNAELIWPNLFASIEF